MSYFKLMALRRLSLLKKSQQGFSILEVLVTILVITGFILGSLQATVLATLLRVQAQDKQEATNWIQQDLELIKFQAFSLPEDTTQCPSNYGEALKDFIYVTFADGENPIVIDGRNYKVVRTFTPSGNILRIEYTVNYASGHPRFQSGGDNKVTTLSTEVLPDAALDCT